MKMRFQKGEFCENWNFLYVNFCLQCAIVTFMNFTGVDKIDSLTLTVPADGIDWIGIGAHSVNEETSAKNEDPERQSICKKMKLLWKELTEKLENDVTTLGLCDLETDVFFNLFNEATIKPANFQV